MNDDLDRLSAGTLEKLYERIVGKNPAEQFRLDKKYSKGR